MFMNLGKKKLADLFPKKLFAVDCLLYQTITTLKDGQTLQINLGTLQLWETANKMEFHPGKCKMLCITNITKPNQFNYRIHSITLAITNAAKYPGVTIVPG